MSSNVKNVEMLISYLIKKVEEIDRKVDKIIKFLNELELINNNITYFTTMIMSEQAKKALEELKKWKI